MKKIFELIKNYDFWTLGRAVFSEIKRKIWRELIKGSYAQDYEDLEIEKIFKKNYRGKYLEIGAYQPKRLSNTYRFYKKGWKGSVIEPNPEVEEMFLESRPRDRFINKGVAEKDGVLNYYQFLIPALNTFSREAANKNVAEGHKIVKIDKIKLISVKKLADNRIDFLSVDTEGMDFEILKSWPWKKCIPKVICLEKDKEEKSEKFLSEKGYKKYFENKVNIIFFWQKLKLGDGRKQ